MKQAPIGHDVPESGARMPPVHGDVSSFPSHGELARTLVEPGGFATLCTVTSDGHPYGSLVAYAVESDGTPYVCVSELAEHTRNARSDPRAALFVASSSVPSHADPLAHPRVTLLGSLAPFDPTHEARDRYLTKHPQAEPYMSFGDFGWWRLQVRRARHVGGFGTMGWVDSDEYRDAPPDPVIPRAVGIREHMNRDHAEACLLYARNLAGIDDALYATLADVDRHGMTLRVDTSRGLRIARVAFDRPVGAAREVRAAAVALLRRARRLGDAA